MPLIDHIVYGPVSSRRLGRSLGVNLLPTATKVCNMNCVYCQYGWTRDPLRYRGQGSGWPSVQAVEAAIEWRLEQAARRNETIDRITIAGHGEPTLHPAFSEAVERICAVRDRLAPPMPVALLSNSTTAGVAAVQSGLNRLDERYMKLDAADPWSCGSINGCPVSLVAIADALRRLPPIVIQAMFVIDAAGAIDNASEVAVSLWLEAVETIAPAGVHIYTIDRVPASAALAPVDPSRLREIGERVRHAGIPAEVFVSDARRRSNRTRES